MSPEARARQRIDELLTAAGWHIGDLDAAALPAARRVAVRESEVVVGYDTAGDPPIDYLLRESQFTLAVLADSGMCIRTN